jgi:hypothetical protein
VILAAASLSVVVVDIGWERGPKMAFVEHRESVETFTCGRTVLISPGVANVRG